MYKCKCTFLVDSCVLKMIILFTKLGSAIFTSKSGITTCILTYQIVTWKQGYVFYHVIECSKTVFPRKLMQSVGEQWSRFLKDFVCNVSWSQDFWSQDFWIKQEARFLWLRGGRYLQVLEIKIQLKPIILNSHSRENNLSLRWRGVWDSNIVL